MTNVLCADLGLSIPWKFFFENFSDCISASVDSAIFIDSTLLKCSIFRSYLSYFHRQIQGMKSFGNAKQAEIFRRGRVWWMGASSERCLKWGGGGH